MAIGVMADAPLIYDTKAYNGGSYGYFPTQTYHSSAIKSPMWLVNSWNQTLTDPSPYLLIALPQVWAGWTYASESGEYGPYIFSTKDLSLVYADPIFPDAKMLGVQQYNGSNYLTFFGGYLIDSSHGAGKCYLMNSHYEIAHVINAVNAPQNVDLHECLLTTDGTAIITSYYNTPYNLTEFGGPANGTLINSMFQEIDIATGDLLFEWKAFDHYPLSYSYVPLNTGGQIDWFHLNSVEKTSEGHYLISALQVGTIAYINGTSGEPIWNLGGKGNNFTDTRADGATTFLSHDARFRNEALTEISYFDNTVLTQEVGCTADCTKGRIVQINTDNMTVTLQRQYFHPLSIQAGPEGNLQITDSGTVLIGWGTAPTITEHEILTAACIWDIQYGIFELAPDNYRAFKSDWVGYPLWPPGIASTTTNASSTVWVSWNGATEVTDWVLLGADDAKSPYWNSSQIVTQVPKSGFETGITVNSTVLYARVAGLDVNGTMLGATEVVEVATGNRTLAVAPVVLTG
ncbi:ASST-domain-containing protein [Xylariales sp. PMI_506]|nr:ASST-domain-containing protein [Xylariales sp. PMI_506]